MGWVGAGAGIAFRRQTAGGGRWAGPLTLAPHPSSLEFGRKQGSSKEEQERKRLIHKHKREFKGAVREIRRDNQFLARMQLSETLERDAERKRKVKQLFNSLATQEGEWKALKRKKFKK